MVSQVVDLRSPREPSWGGGVTVTRRTKLTSGHITTPAGQGPWAPDLDHLRVGPNRISDDANKILGYGRAFPQFQGPGRDELREILLQQKELEGWKYRVFGKDRIQAALNELRERGLFGSRQASQGRCKGGAGSMARVFSYGNEPWKHLDALAALADDEIRHHAAQRLADRERRRRQFEAALARRDGQFEAAHVVDLAEHRLNRAG